MKRIGIYGLRNKYTDVWYIGQSWDIAFRWNKYRLGHCKKQCRLYNALMKYGYDNFEKRIIEVCDEDIPQEMLDAKETAWIKHFNSVENGYNLTYGGFGGKKSEETRRKIGELHRGRKHSEETRRKMSASHSGKVRTIEHQMRLNASNTGKKRSIESRLKMSNSGKLAIHHPLSEDAKQKIREKAILRGPLSADHRNKLCLAWKKRKLTANLSKI